MLSCPWKRIAFPFRPIRLLIRYCLFTILCLIKWSWFTIADTCSTIDNTFTNTFILQAIGLVNQDGKRIKWKILGNFGNHSSRKVDSWPYERKGVLKILLSDLWWHEINYWHKMIYSFGKIILYLSLWWQFRTWCLAQSKRMCECILQLNITSLHDSRQGC